MSRRKKEKVKRPFYKEWWFWTILFLLIYGVLGGKNGNNLEDNNTLTIIETVPQFTTEVFEKKSNDIPSGDDPTNIEERNYIDDMVVNKFISDYNGISESGFTEIERGSIRTKYFAYSYGYYCELLNSSSSGKICVTIDETNENASLGVEGMRDIFRDVIRAIDSSVDDDEIYNCFDSLILDGKLKSDVSLGDTVITFCPDAELSYGYSRGHIRIEAK